MLSLCGPNVALKTLTEEMEALLNSVAKRCRNEKWEESKAGRMKVGGKGQEKIKGFCASFIDAQLRLDRTNLLEAEKYQRDGIQRQKGRRK